MKLKLIRKQTDLPLTEADHCEVRQSTQTLAITAEDMVDLTILEPLTLNPES
jgi:hypothetical protein